MKIKSRLYTLITCFVLCAMFSCNPNSADLPIVNAKAGNVSFFNLIPYGNAIDFYINGTRQNSNKISYNEYSGYISIISGPQSIVFKTDTNRINLFDPIPVTLASDSTTMFVTGKAASNIIITRDTAKTDNKNYRPKLRFVNASANSPAFDLTLNGVSITNTAYKTISAYTRVDTGKVNLNLKLLGTNTSVISRTTTLQSNKVYTLFVYGSYNGTGSGALNLGIIANY